MSGQHSSPPGANGAPGARRARPALLPTLAAVLVVALTVSLGLWQTRRAQEKAQWQAQRDAALSAGPVLMPGTLVDAGRLDGWRVTVRGRFLPQLTVFIDNRTYRGAAGFHVVTPVRIEGSDRGVLVLRGWIAQDAHDRNRLPQVLTPAGDVVLEGFAQTELPPSLELTRAPLPGPGERLWQNLSPQAFERWSGQPVQHLIVRQSPQSSLQDGLVRDWPVAGNDVDKHHGYAFQWFAMAAVTAGLWVYFSFFRRRDDRTDSR